MTKLSTRLFLLFLGLAIPPGICAEVGAQKGAPTLSAQPQATLLWQGFHHRWKKTPHRLNRLGSYFRNLSYDVGDDTLTAEHREIFRVGAYDDTGRVKSTGTFLRSDAIGIYHGYVDESCLALAGDIGDKDSVSCRQKIKLKDAGLGGFDDVTVVLRGFQLKAVSYDKGYNTRGFAVRVIPRGTAKGVLEFDAYMMVHPEHSPDRPQLDDKCWQDDHCRHYRYEGRIYYTVIGVKKGAGAITSAGTDSPTNSYVMAEDMSPFEYPDEAPEFMRSAFIEGEPGFKHGLTAMQGFSWHLSAWSDWWDNGRYIRDVAMNLSDITYDVKRGRADFLTNMYFTNTGALPLGYEADFRMWNTLIQFNDGDFARSDKRWFTGTIIQGEDDYTRSVAHDFSQGGP